MTDHNLIELMVTDPSLPWEHRYRVLRDLVNTLNPQTEPVVKAIMEHLASKSADQAAQEKAKQLDAILKEMQEGPMRGATFVELLTQDASPVTVALALLDDGTEAFVVVPFPDRLPALQLGDRVVLDGKGRVLLRRATSSLSIGEVAQFERRIDARHVQVSLRANAERSVFLATQSLLDKIQSGEVSPGSPLIVNVRRSLALAAIPAEDGLSHYRYLRRGSVPDVVPGREIGDPAKCIEEIARHIRLELTRPELRRRYRLPRSCTKLLCGPSGTGKSLTVSAIHRRIYDTMSEVTGVPVEELPPRVFTIRQSEILSMWLGESEKNWQRAMDEALQLADEPFTGRDGRQWTLPVLIVLEEVDGMGRARQQQEAIQGRILNTVLASLDPGRLEWRNRMLIVLATTNEPHLIDPALVRRLGGSIEYFPRLRRRSFMAVLRTLTRGLPVAANNGCSPEELWNRHIENLAAWLFSPNGSDPGLVELTYAGSTTPVIKYRRDFLTGAIVDSALQEAANEAALREHQGGGPLGITLENLMRALDTKLRGITDQLKEHNVGSYTDLPDGARVATLRRIPQPAHLPIEFHRN